MDPLLCDLPVPALQEPVHLLQALEAPGLERVVLVVAAAALLDALLLGMPRARREGDETPMTGEGLVELGKIRVVEAGANDCGFQVVMPDHPRGHASKLEEGMLMGAQEAGSFLSPERL